MDALIDKIFFPVFALGTFIAVVLLIEGLYVFWNSYRGPEAKKIEQRLRTISASSDISLQSAVLKKRMLSEVDTFHRLLMSIPRVHHLDRFILQSGLNWSVATIILLSAIGGLAGYFFAKYYLQSLLLILTFSLTLGGALLPILYVQWKRSKRLHKIEQQLPDALDLIGRALRAGHSFPSGLKMVGEEMNDPIAGEFAITHDEVNFGVSLQQALTNLGYRIPITDLRYFIVAVLIQREAGGNLTEVLSNLSKLIRSRLQLHGKIRVLTAEGRISAWTLGLLPFALAGLMNWGNPTFIRVLWTDPAGIKLTQIMLAIMAVGALWLWRLTKVRV
jgi:tight adherence protein B